MDSAALRSTEQQRTVTAAASSGKLHSGAGNAHITGVGSAGKGSGRNGGTSAGTVSGIVSAIARIAGIDGSGAGNAASGSVNAHSHGSNDFSYLAKLIAANSKQAMISNLLTLQQMVASLAVAISAGRGVSVAADGTVTDSEGDWQQAGRKRRAPFAGDLNTFAALSMDEEDASADSVTVARN